MKDWKYWCWPINMEYSNENLPDPISDLVGFYYNPSNPSNQQTNYNNKQAIPSPSNFINTNYTSIAEKNKLSNNDNQHVNVNNEKNSTNSLNSSNVSNSKVRSISNPILIIIY